MDIAINDLVPELSVSDLDRSLAFYVGVLGFAVAFQRPEEGFAFLHLNHAQLMLDEIGKGRTWATGELAYPLGRGINLQVVVDSIEPLLQRLAAAGIALFLDPEEKWYRVGKFEAGNHQFCVQDPDGYLLRLTKDLGSRPL